MYHRIKTVAAMLGIPRSTLLAWERRHGVVRPERLANGYRAYSEADIARLRSLKRLIDGGMRISEAVSHVGVAANGPSSPLRSSPSPRSALLEALLACDADHARALATSLSGWTFRDRLHQVWAPLLHDVGEGWAAGTVTVAQEHFATAFVRDRMGAMLTALGAGPTSGPPCLCAGAPDDRHELGPLCVAIELALAGWRVTWLGPDVPTDALAALARQRQPALVCVSVTRSRPVEELVALATELRAQLPKDTRLTVGGRAVAGVSPPEVKGVVWATDNAAALSLDPIDR